MVHDMNITDISIPDGYTTISYSHMLRYTWKSDNLRCIFYVKGNWRFMTNNMMVNYTDNQYFFTI